MILKCRNSTPQFSIIKDVNIWVTIYKCKEAGSCFSAIVLKAIIRCWIYTIRSFFPVLKRNTSNNYLLSVNDHIAVTELIISESPLFRHETFNCLQKIFDFDSVVFQFWRKSKRNGEFHQQHVYCMIQSLCYPKTGCGDWWVYQSIVMLSSQNNWRIKWTIDSQTRWSHRFRLPTLSEDVVFASLILT